MHVLMPATVSVAPHAGAWIETLTTSAMADRTESSPLTQGRGLKHCQHACSARLASSPLTQGRGLKHVAAAPMTIAMPVAPHAGAWIETSRGANTSASRGRPSRGGVD